MKSIKVILLVPLVFSFLSSCGVWDYLSTPDNAIEEIAEGVLDHYTGIDIDFTPNSGPE